MFNLKPPEFNRKRRLFPRPNLARGIPSLFEPPLSHRGLPLELAPLGTGSNNRWHPEECDTVKKHDYLFRPGYNFTSRLEMMFSIRVAMMRQ